MSRILNSKPFQIACFSGPRIGAWSKRKPVRGPKNFVSRILNSKPFQIACFSVPRFGAGSKIKPVRGPKNFVSRILNSKPFQKACFSEPRIGAGSKRKPVRGPKNFVSRILNSKPCQIACFTTLWCWVKKKTCQRARELREHDFKLKTLPDSLFYHALVLGQKENLSEGLITS